MLRGISVSLALMLGNCIGITPTPESDDFMGAVPAACNHAVVGQAGAPWRAPKRSIVDPFEVDTAGFDSFGYPRATPDRRILHSWLVNGKFDELDSALSDIRMAVREDIHRELWLFDAYEVFDEPGEAITRGIEAWLAAKPQSLAAMEAHALHIEALGWAARGQATIGKTTQEQLSTMRTHFAVAGQKASRILEGDRGSLLATKILIRMEKASLNPATDRIEQWIKNADQSKSRFLREIQLHGLARRWGGSVEQMRSVLEAISLHFETHPELRALCGYVVKDAVKPRIDHDWKAALSAYEHARTYGELPAITRQLAASTRLTGNPQRALRIATDGLAAHPQSRDLLKERAYGALVSNQTKVAWTTCASLAAMNPDSDSAKKCRATVIGVIYKAANAAYHEKDFSRAIQGYSEILELGSSPAGAVYWRGRAQEQLGNTELALTDIRHAIELDPSQLKFYNHMAYLLQPLGRVSEILPLSEKYVKLHPNDPDGLAHLGTVRTFSGQIKQGLSDLQRACSQGSHHGCEGLVGAPTANSLDIPEV